MSAVIQTGGNGSRRPRAGVLGAFILALGLLLSFPFLLQGKIYLLHLMCTVFLNVVVILGLVVILGYSKQFSLGQVAFYAIGAYVTAFLTAQLQVNYFAAMALSGLFAAAVAFVVAIPAARFHGPWLALVTFAFAEIVRIVIIRAKGITGGFGGFFNIPKPSIGDFVFDNDFKFYFLFMTVMLLSLVAVRWLRSSPLGKIWVSLGDNEELAASIGINALLHKLLSFSAGSFLAGIAGSLYAGYAGFISPESFTLHHTIYFLCIFIVGGMESIAGNVLSTVFFAVLSSYLMAFYPWDMVIFGSIIVLFVNLLPEGMGHFLDRFAMLGPCRR
jgi:ABC-type branched-subunit amino acid transport system permease subunit